MKAIWIGTALIVLVCGVAFSRPEVRDWMDERFPVLGINGKAPRETSIVSTDPGAIAPESLEGSPRIRNIDYPGTASDATQIAFNQAGPQDGSLPTLPSGPALVTGPNQGASAPSLPALSPLPSATLENSQGPGFAQQPTYSGNITAPKETRRTADGRLISDFATLDFVRKIDVVAQADGIITELSVDDGSYVRAGAPILKLDSRIAEAEVKVQTRELEQAQLKARNTAQIEFAKASFEKARIEVEISEKLQATRAEGDDVLRAKMLERKKAELQITVSEIENAQDKAAVTVSEAKLDAANVQTALRTILAPWDGYVNEISKHQHSYVRAGEIVCTLCDLSKMRVKGIVTVDIPPHLLYGAPVVVKIAVAKGIEKEIQGKINYVSYETKSSQINNQQYPVWVEINNEQLPDGQYLLRKGMVATLIIQPNT